MPPAPVLPERQALRRSVSLTTLAATEVGRVQKSKQQSPQPANLNQ